MIPLFALGIPGDTFTAVMLGAMMVHGLQPGPLVMTKNADFIYGIFVALLLANLLCVTLQYFGIKIFVRLLAVPKHILLPIIMVLSLVGAIAINNRVFDAWVVLAFGIVGIVMNKLKFPITPIILGFILGPLAEENLRRALMLSRGALLPLVSNLPSIILICLSILSLAIAPRLMKLLSIVGTLAMFLVGGGIIVHGIAPLHHAVEQWAGEQSALIASLLPTGVNLVLGFIVGAVVLAGVKVISGFRATAE